MKFVHDSGHRLVVFNMLYMVKLRVVLEVLKIRFAEILPLKPLMPQCVLRSAAGRAASGRG